MACSLEKRVETRIKAFLEGDFNSTPYLIMTLFGDSILPQGGEIWLGSLVQLLQPLGISERLVRTSVFRLAKDSWLESKKIGRKSYYKPCDTDEIEKNESRIYYQQQKWDGNWRLLIGTKVESPSPKKEEFRKILAKHGFCSIASNVYLHPTIAYCDLDDLLKQFHQADSYIVLSTRNPDGSPLTFERIRQVYQRCVIENITAEYAAFVERYRPIYQCIQQVGRLTDEQNFLLRTLLINDYRHLLWHDVIHSNLLFGDNWVGRGARQITANIYCAVESSSSRHFCDIAVNSQGKLPRVSERSKKRFQYLCKSSVES